MGWVRGDGKREQVWEEVHDDHARYRARGSVRTHPPSHRSRPARPKSTPQACSPKRRMFRNRRNAAHQPGMDRCMRQGAGLLTDEEVDMLFSLASSLLCSPGRFRMSGFLLDTNVPSERPCCMAPHRQWGREGAQRTRSRGIPSLPIARRRFRRRIRSAGQPRPHAALSPLAKSRNQDFCGGERSAPEILWGR